MYAEYIVYETSLKRLKDPQIRKRNMNEDKKEIIKKKRKLITEAAVKKILVCRQPTGSYLTYRVKLFVSVFLLHSFFFDYKNK